MRPRSVPPAAEVVLPFPVPKEQLKEAYAFRTTWLASSLAALRERGYFDRYLVELPSRYHEGVLSSVAGEWAPIDVAIQHYAACERLGISPEDCDAISSAVTKRVHGSTLNIIVRLAKQTGVSPWTALAQLNRLWERVWNGGGTCVYKLGPKDALVEIAEWPPARIPYVREAMPAIMRGILELFARRVFAYCVPEMSGEKSLAIHVSWV